MRTPKPAAEVTSLPESPLQDYQIVGLQEADQMPIAFNGREFDLANLSTDDVAYLLGFPEQVPHLKKLDVSQASV
jgi:hypothetical protein